MPPDASTGDFLNSILFWITQKILLGALAAFQLLMSWWVDMPTLGISDQGGTFEFLREHTGWLTAVMAIAGLLVASGRVAIQRKGEPFREAFSQLVVLVVIVFTLAAAVNLANLAGDAYSKEILQSVMPADGNWTKDWIGGLNTLSVGSDGFAIILLFIALAMIISVLIQFGLMLFRSAVLVLLVGVLPVVAATRFSRYGDNAHRKAVGWLITFVVYKPVAATIYATALRMVTSRNPTENVLGLYLLIGAVLALPATMRLIVPAVSEVNSVSESVGGTLRKAGHLVYGSTAVNAGRGASYFRPGGRGAGRPLRGAQRPNGGGPNGGGPNGTPGPNGGGPNGTPGPNGGGPNGTPGPRTGTNAPPPPPGANGTPGPGGGTVPSGAPGRTGGTGPNVGAPAPGANGAPAPNGRTDANGSDIVGSSGGPSGSNPS